MNKKKESLSLDNNLIMYILVNNNLNMGKGKITVQVPHSACNITNYLTKYPTNKYKKWLQTGMTKIVLRSD